MCAFRCELWDGSRDMQIGHDVRSIFSSLKYILLKYNTRTNEHERERGRERERGERERERERGKKERKKEK